MLSLFPVRLLLSQILHNFSRKIEVLDKNKMEIHHHKEQIRIV